MPPGRWVWRPAQYVMDASMPDACLLAAEEAVLFWERAGVDYLVARTEPHDWIGFHGLPPAGSIAVTSAPLREGVAGECRVARYQHQVTSISSADIVIAPDYCMVEVIAHELGHALGLDHHDDWRNVMFRVAVPGEREVDDDQKAWVQ